MSEREEPGRFARRHRKIITLRDGTDIEVRPVTPADAETLRTGFDELSAQSRWRRFMRPVTRLTDKEVAYLTDIDYVDHFAWGAQTLDRPPVGIGVARFVRDKSDPTAAEIAIVVADAWQRRGVATVLLELLVLSAADRGIERFWGYVAASNDGARKLLTGLGARGRFDQGMWVAELRLPDATSSIRGTPLYEALTAAASGQVRFEPPRTRVLATLRRLWRRRQR